MNGHKHGSPVPYLLAYGAFSVSGQVLLLREILLFSRGNEICAAFAMAFFPAWTGLGAFLGGRMARSGGGTRGLLDGCLIVLALCLPLTVLAMAAARGGAVDSPLEIPPLTDIVLLAILSPSFFSFCSGCVFPLAVAVLNEKRPAAENTAGRAYGMESAGGGLGTILVTLVLFPRCEPLGLALGLASFLCGACAATQSSGIRRRITAGLALALLLAGLWGAPDRLAHRLRWPGVDFLAASSTSTAYLEAISIGGETSLYENGALAATRGDDRAAERLCLVTLAEKPAAGRILVIGGSASTLPGRLSRNGKIRVTLVENRDERALRFSTRFGFSPPAGFGAFIREDERTYLHESLETYDAVVVAKPPADSLAANRFTTSEFFRDVARHLKEGGILVFGVESSSLYPSPSNLEYLACLKKTLTPFFGKIFMIPGDTVIFVASTDSRFKLFSGDSDPGKTAYWDALFGRNLPVSGAFLSRSADTLSPGLLPNRDLNPRGFLARLEEELYERQSPLRKAAKALFHVHPGWFFIFPFLFPPAAVLFRKQKKGALFSAFASGFASMGFSVLLLLTFSVRFGTLFGHIGFLSAFFMLGLAAGSMWFSRLAALQHKRSRNRLLAALLLQATVSLSLLGPPAWIPAYFLLAFLSGLGTGSSFPLLVAASRGGTRGAGLIYAADLLGAGLGALCSGSVAAALLGIPECAVWLSLVGASACLGAIGLVPFHARQ